MNKLNKNKIIIILTVIISLILVGIIFLIGACSHKDEEEAQKIQGLTNTQENTDNKKLASTVVEGVTYNDLEKLSAEQRAVQNQYIRLISNAIMKNTTGIAPKTVNIKEINSNNDVIVNVVYEDNTTREFIVIYDGTKYHKFLRSLPIEEYERIMSGADAG